MIKLTAFRIRNFRSISDTGWQNLSPDNITCLIGQNESGKTSILEGLKVFYSGVISEDVLRSDLSLPEVSCRFSIPEGWLNTITDNTGTELKELLSRLDHLELSRVWIADLSSVIHVGGEILEYLDSLEDAWRIYLEDVEAKMTEEMDRIGELEISLEEILGKEAAIKSIIPDIDTRRGFRLFGKKQTESGLSSNISLPDLKNQLNELKKQKSDIVEELKDKQLIKRAGDKWNQLKLKCVELDKHVEELSVKLEERHQEMTLLMRPLEDESDRDWRETIEDFRQTRSERDIKVEELERQVALSGYIIEGKTEEEAEISVNGVINSYKSQYNNGVLGIKYFEYCPVFELFEDFGSLLPNRIDMEDIIQGNDKVEGYKAARNFLSLAKLDHSFFEQPSSRILKQKIENLNHELTRNFHDFWQQSIGRNNKINIQFELDHYSSSYGVKAGKPYLEFWIKDEGERLYPKQRSRGVRWFLSFYLELKASATISKRQIILLVDEPGVSLHARAQEDVLKVFEDIKDKIHVIYTTHSPHLVEINKLHRVLAVQRDDLDSMRSTTRVLDPLRLSGATPDTLTPLQSILGNPMEGIGFSAKRKNIVVNDTGSYYLLTAILNLNKMADSFCAIPSTSVSSMPLLCNILMGWGIDFAVLLFDNDEEQQITKILKDTVFKTDEGGGELLLRMKSSFLNSEDLLSTLDFKQHILNSREGITVPNSVYSTDNDLARNFVHSRFLTNVKSGKIKISDFDEETIENFRELTEILRALK